MGWSCLVCTYRNRNDGAKTCFTCGSDRPKKESSSVAIDLTNDGEDSDPKIKKKRGSTVLVSSHSMDQSVEKETKKSKLNRADNDNSIEKRKSVVSEKSSDPLRQSTMPLPACGSGAYRPIQANENLESRSRRSKVVMKETFQIENLRNQQPKAVECALKGQSQIVVMATGGGKSLCFQLPAVVIGGTTIVISPLIALMRDQVDSLLKKGVSAACINSSNKESENALIYDRLVGRRLNATKRKKDEVLSPISIVYVTPESLQTSRFQSILKELYDKKRLALFAIDESHCLSTWGHDFRPAYRRLDYIANNFPKVPLMALTATATPKVIKDIQQTLKLGNAPCHVGSFDRPNIFYKVHYKDGLEGMETGGSLKDICKFIQKHHKKAKKKDEPCSGIVYVHKRDDTMFLAKEITQRTGIKAAAYHGALKNAERTQVQQDWTSGEVAIVCATISFGMGIDLAHVRYVVHWSIPKTLDGFYQESGRAGRDGLPAISLVYFSRDDANKFAFLINVQEENRKKKSGETVDSNSLKRNQEALQQVVDYCTTSHCRRQFVLKHFGEKETDPKTVCQKSCDFCSNPDRIEKAIRSSEALRAIKFQKKEAAKKKKKQQEWNGQWDRPHGDTGGEENDDFYDKRAEDWEVEGLGITSEAKERPRFVGSKAFVSAKTLASKLDSLEAMEMQENESNGFECNGFVRFKTVKKKERDYYPEHFKEQLAKVASANAASQAKPRQRSSTEIAESAAKLREELAAIEAKKKALMNKVKKTEAPTAPPAPTFGQKRIKPSKRKK